MGAGSWGTAFAAICADAGNEVVMWARRAQVAEEVRRRHRNSHYLGDVALPEQLTATADAEEALAGAELIAVAIPSHALRASLASWRALVPPAGVAISLVKGVELDTHRRASEVVREEWDLPAERVVVVSGPNFAAECARRLPSGTVAACPDLDVATRVQAACHTPSFRVWTNPDLLGVELGGACKNAIAIAAGVADGMGMGDNTKAMLITRGLAETTRLAVAQGADALTMQGLSGMGDLVATCTSRWSRNRHVGEQLGRGRTLDAVLGEMTMVAEGIKSSKAIADMAAYHGVEMPIVEHVVKVVHDRMDIAEMGQALMLRSPKEEFHSLPRA